MAWQDRVNTELRELLGKVILLSTFITSDPMYSALPPKQRELLELQHTVMNQYVRILQERLKDA